MTPLALIGLLKIEFPTGDLLLCDGGFVAWGGDTYVARDATFGSLGGMRPLAEGVSQSVPALEVTLLPPGSAAAGDLSQDGFQTAPARLWLAEFNPATGLVSGTPDLLFSGQVDQTVLAIEDDGRRTLSVTIVSLAERLFEGNTGNSLNATFHKSVWSGELGHDNATGMSLPVAWGAEASPGTVGSGMGAVQREVVSPWNIRYV